MGNHLFLSGTVFAAGFLSFFAPCTFPLIPVYLGILSDREQRYRRIQLGSYSLDTGGILKTLAFVFGISMSFVLLGFGAGFLGSFLSNRWLPFFAGLLVILLGIHQTELIRLKALDRLSGISLRTEKGGVLGSFLTGIAFSLGWTPCVGPILGAVLTLAAAKGTAYYGALLMLLYALGLALPFLIMMLASDFVMRSFPFLKKQLLKLKKAGGVLLILMGLLLMGNQLNSISAFLH